MKTFDKTRPLSWSAISSFEYDKEQWYKKYVLREIPDDNKEMAFGRAFAKSIEDGNPMAPVPTYSRVEYPFKVVFGKIPLIGFADTFCDVTKKKLGEYKTGKKVWDQKRADEHRQIDMYLLMNLITNKVKPEDVECALVWIPTQENGDFSISLVEPIVPRIFKTKRTTAQVLKFGSYIQEVYRDMELYAATHS